MPSYSDVGAAASGHTHTLDNLSNVTVPSPDDGDVLVYDEDTSTWISAPAPSSISPASTVTSETTLNNTSSSAGTSADYSRGDHTHGTPPMPTYSDVGAAASDHSHDLDDLNDVDAAAPDDGDVLTYDSEAGDWIPVAPVVYIPGESVTSETSLDNTASAIGVSTNYARADHTHGTPPMPDLDDLSDVNATSPDDEDVLGYDSGTSNWVPVVRMSHAQVMARIWVQV
jgi:hypothetical protein